MITWALAIPGGQPAWASNDGPLVANIGHALTSNPTSWSTAATRTVNKNQAVYFRAMNAAGTVPIQTDVDWDMGLQDDADYDWDYCWQTDWDCCDSRSACVAYAAPGDRIAHLRVDDDDAPDLIDDVNVCDDVLISVTMTVETDWMSGYGLVSMDLFPGRWAGAGYSSVVIDGDHDTNCEHREYLYDSFQSDAALTAWLDNYENQNCDLYLIGIDKFSTDPDWDYDGYCWAGKYSCICRGKGAGLDVELHEPACHDPDVGAIGHCTSANPCACKEEATADTFCASCKQELKDYIRSRSP